ncbi:zinc-ribbon domain-containing protein [Streptomyces sp. NPDC001933]|uniref:zinc-ribbon domain-containing protein n=1 Tax=Streptomyces sp. NPDC001933 TaxID=3364626 RepID=UPI0036CB8C5B
MLSSKPAAGAWLMSMPQILPDRTGAVRCQWFLIDPTTMNDGCVFFDTDLPFPRQRGSLSAEAFVAQRRAAADWLHGQEQALSEVFLAEGRDELPVDDYLRWRQQQQRRLGQARKGWTDALAEAGWSMNSPWAYLRPDLLTEYDAGHPENRPERPFEEKVTSTTSVWWRCIRDENHQWRTSVHNRHAIGTGCPRCAKRGVSRREQDVFTALRERCPELESPASVPRVRTDSGTRRMRAWRVDMLLPGTPAVVVEYDGAYWHKDRLQKDRAKTADLSASGCVVIRVREDPLPAVTSNDIVCAQDLPAREVAELVHHRIDELARGGRTHESVSTPVTEQPPEQLDLFSESVAPDSSSAASRGPVPAALGAHTKAVVAILIHEGLLAVHEGEVRGDCALGTQQPILQMIPQAFHEQKCGLVRFEALAKAAARVMSSEKLPPR